MEAILSCSGGLDSTSLLLNLLKNGFTPHIVNFNYGSSQNMMELIKLSQNLNYLKSKGFNIDFKTLDMSEVMNNLSSSLTRRDIETPDGEYCRENQKVIFVPNRNAIFASIIYAHALTLFKDTGNDVSICMGIHANEVSVYPDCTPEFFDKLFNAFTEGNFDSEHIHAYNPYVNVTKQEVLEDAIDSCNKLGLDLDIIMKNTLSCYKPVEGKACGKCPTCVEENQRVLMADFSTKPIKDVKVGDKVFSIDENTRNLKIAKVLNVMDNGIKPVYDMNGLLLTDDHRVFIRTSGTAKFREYKTLNRKDAEYIAYRVPSEYIRDADDEKFALGYMRGIVDSDGHIGNRGVFLCQKTRDIVDEFKQLYTKFIDSTETQVKFDESRGMFVFDGGYSPKFNEKTAYSDNIEYARGYLNGFLMGDGCLTIRKKDNALIMILMQSLDANEQKCNIIQKYIDMLGLKYCTCDSKTGGFKAEGSLMKSWYIQQPYFVALRYGCSKKEEWIKKIETRNFRGSLSRHLNKVNVGRIGEPVKEAHVYDITTESHTFICEGYIVHNCLERLSIFKNLGLTDPAEYI